MLARKAEGRLHQENQCCTPGNPGGGDRHWRSSRLPSRLASAKNEQAFADYIGGYFYRLRVFIRVCTIIWRSTFSPVEAFVYDDIEEQQSGPYMWFKLHRICAACRILSSVRGAITFTQVHHPALWPISALYNCARLMECYRAAAYDGDVIIVF